MLLASEDIKQKQNERTKATDWLLLLQSLWFKRKCSMLCHSRPSSLYDYSISSKKVNRCRTVSSEPLLDILPELVRYIECFFPNLYSKTCLESRGCHLIPHSYLISCFCCVVVLLFLSCDLSFFLLMVHSPDFLFIENS